MVRYQLTVDAGHDPESGRRRQVRRRFATEAAARAELAELQGTVTAGTYVHASKLTVDAVCEAWLASKHSLKPSTLQGHRVKLQALRDELGSLEVQKLSKADLDGLIGRLRRGEVEDRKAWTPRSCNYLLYLTVAVLDDQVKQGHVVRNVARLVDRVAGDPQKFRTLTADEMFKILDHDCRDRHLWTLALYGLRRGEIAGLRWTNVNLTDKAMGEGDDQLPAKSVRIVENRVAIGRQIEKGTPKSKASNRTLPMPDEVVAVLKAARKRQAEERLAFGEGYGSGEYVACDETGQPYHPNLLTFRWGRMLDGLKIKRVRLHDGRHSCATLMHLRQVPIAVIAAWLGHASAAFTMSVYAHSQDDALKDAGASFGRVVTTRDTETGSGV
ncbi:site-specific integrase [Mycobacterium sp. UM_CSW]|uniref:site-specific integrase n=1 Tax=Mycobacterium sp. UM_CSW TaxID=1370119 RepID=UPI001EF9F6B0|nr:site-specific integrase [Mycobacterium sp. UM_CSW]